MSQNWGGSPDLMVETSGLFLAFACAAAVVLGSAGPPVTLLPVSVRWSPAGSWTLDRTREGTQGWVSELLLVALSPYPSWGPGHALYT